MKPITKGEFVEIKSRTPLRRCFTQSSGVQKCKANPSFSVKFIESIGLIYETMTGNKLQHSLQYGNYWNFLRNEADIQLVENWEMEQGERVFLRDCLSCSIALGVNMANVATGERTELGELEYQAKNNSCEESIHTLANQMAEAIETLPFYKDATLIAAVPARPGKTTADLPTELAKRIAEAKGLTDLTPHFQYGGVREQLKTLPLSERWDAWEGAQLKICDEGKGLLDGNSVILIDDKYQSGVSANFVGMILQQAGASEIYGLYAVKTMRDTDNQG